MPVSSVKYLARTGTAVSLLLLLGCDTSPLEPRSGDVPTDPPVMEYDISGIVENSGPPGVLEGATVWVRSCDVVDGAHRLFGDSTDSYGRFEFRFSSSDLNCPESRVLTVWTCKVGWVIEDTSIDAGEQTHTVRIELSTTEDWGWTGPARTRAESCPQL